ncbi:MAG: hypothetical protein P8018_03205 [Acidobacteriota bacterium]|jgi:hypothetical protein
MGDGRYFIRMLYLAVFLAGAALPGTALRCQDFGVLLLHPPAPGAWAQYTVTTRSKDHVKTEPLRLAVTGKKQVGDTEYLWIEISPQDFGDDKGGTLRLLLKAHPTGKEALDPFQQALAVEFKPKDKPAFAMSRSALSFWRRHNSAEIKQREKTLAPAMTLISGGTLYACEKRWIETHYNVTFQAFLFIRKTLLKQDKGTYWISTEAPFRIVKADITRTVTRDSDPPRTVHVTVTLDKTSWKGAETRFTKPVTDVRGLWSLLTH